MGIIDYLPGTDHYQLIIKLLSWPPQFLLPVLDLLRLLFLHPHASEVLASPPRTIPGKHIDILKYLLDVLSVQPQTPTNGLLALRALTNMFCCSNTRKILETNWTHVLQSIAGSTSGDSRTTLAAATVLLNYGVQTQGVKGGEVKGQCLLILKEILKVVIAASDVQSELLVRVLVAIGTFLWQDPQAVQIAHSIGIKPMLMEIGQNKDKDVNDCLSELLRLAS